MNNAATKRKLALPLWAAALMICTLGLAQANAATVSAPTDFVIAQGQTGAVPISVTDAGAGVVGVDVTLQYDSSVIEVFGSGSTAIQQSGFATDGWILEQNIVTVAGNTKEIRISAASGGASLPSSGTSTLFTITFQAASATSPASSALTLALADLNETAVVAANGSVKLGGITGGLVLTPNPVKPSKSVTVTLTDGDLDISGAAETVTVTVRSKTSGGATKESQSVLLTETGANTGIFTGTVSTVYGATGVAGGAFEVEPGDDMEGEYTDGFDASGDAGTVVTDLIDVVTGVDGTVSTSPTSVSAGSNVTVTVTDADEVGVGSLQVQVSVRRIAASGITTIETEAITLTESPASSGIFIASVPTSSAAGSQGDGTLNVNSGDQILVSYDDVVGSTGAPVVGISSITATDGVFSGVPGTIEVGESFEFTLADGDIGDGTRVSGSAQINVTIRNSSTGETETRTLSENPAGSGTFPTDGNSISTVFSNGSSTDSAGNGVLGVKPGDVVVIEYADPLDASGGSSTISSTSITVATGVTGTVSSSPSSINAGDNITITVTDADMTGFVSFAYHDNVQIQVKRGGGVISTSSASLLENPANSGIFTATISTSAFSLQAGDQLVVLYDDLVGSGGVPVNDILSVTAADGAFNSVPASIKVADALSLSLTDADIADGTRVNGAGTLSVTVRNNTSGETEAVTLTETPAGSGTFTSSLNTAFSGGGTANNDGTLGVAVGDVVVFEYGDNLGASGSAATITSSNINVVGGGDGTVTTTPASINPGASVTVTVQDADLGNSGSVQATVRSTRGGNALESVALTLNATGSNNEFTGNINTAFSSGATISNSILEVQAGDQIVADYVDQVTSGGGAVTRTSSPATTVTGGATGTIVASADIQAGDGLRIEVADSDLNVSFTTAETASATVTNNTNGDVETVTLTETGINTGIFRATPPATTGSGSATSGDGTVQVSAHDAITVSYNDVLDASGGTTLVSAAVQGVLWGDTSDNNKLGALDASQILQRSVLLISFNAYQETVANVDAAGGITAFDASQVLQYVVGIINIFPIQSGVPDPHPYKRVVDERLISFGQPEQQGARLRLPIVLDEMRDVLSGQITLAYDPQAYRVLGVVNTENTADYLVASNANAGELLIGLAGAQSQATGAGAILEVELEVLGAGDSESLRIKTAAFNGGQIAATPVASLSLVQPKAFSLSANWPNPFNPATSLRYALPEASQVELVVYDMLGQKVQTLVSDMQPTGAYTVQWNGRNEMGHAVASGLYFYRIEAGGFVQTRKMTLLR